MTSRRFAIFLIGGAFLLFLATVTANVMLDPEQVFGTGLYSHKVNINERVRRLRQYQQQAESVDGLLFSSSRGNLLDPYLEKGMGLSHFANASMSYGMVSDYVPLLEYIVRDKSTRAIKLKHVFLLLDIDFFGRPSWTNSNINSFLPPEISEESAARFWWRYLTAFQYRLWGDVIREDRRRKEQTRAAAASGEVDARGQINQAEAIEAVRSSPLAQQEYRRRWNAVRPDLDRQLALLQRLVALCRENQIRLTVAISPLQAWNLDLNGRAEVNELTERLSRITPLFDFNAVPLIADKDEYWLDNSHFDQKAAAMMVARIFGTGADVGWGELRGAENDDGRSVSPRPTEGGVVAPRAMNETPLEAR